VDPDPIPNYKLRYFYWHATLSAALLAYCEIKLRNWFILDERPGTKSKINPKQKLEDAVLTHGFYENKLLHSSNQNMQVIIKVRTICTPYQQRSFTRGF
jgi:hypothetical protein